MSIVFEHVEGVVQKAESTSPSPDGGGGPSAHPKPQHEAFEEMRRRMERMMKRVHAD